MRSICTVADCGIKTHAHGLCQKHSRRMQRHGTVEPTQRPRGAGNIGKDGRIRIKDAGRLALAHVWVAERALGRKLPENAVVHHVNKDPQDNRPENLVICPDQTYHMLLHSRERALDDCGNPNYRKCIRCRKYDDPSAMELTEWKQHRHPRGVCSKADRRA